MLIKTKSNRTTKGIIKNATKSAPQPGENFHMRFLFIFA